jgi:predicted metal-dependent HD superfamily phosphohydrolase
LPVDLPWPLPHRADLRDRLSAVYDGPARGYHDLTHLGEVLARLGELGALDDTEVVLAAWFHDAVYDGGPDDEERSARLAETELAGEAVDVDVPEVARLVRLTATHRPEPGDTRGERLSDADLAILAAPEERYAAYVAGVRREYAAVPDHLFAQGRAAVLADLLAKPAVFHTPHARAHWEDRARDNLSRELQRLHGG